MRKTPMRIMLESLERVLEIQPHDKLLKTIQENAEILLLREENEILQIWTDGRESKAEGDVSENARKYYKELYGEVLPNKIHLWIEGYAVTGESQKAYFLGSIEAENLDEAVRKFDKENPDREVQLNYFGEGKHAIWGCQIFDNEKDARKSFG